MVLRHTHSDPETSPPTIDDEWAYRFLEENKEHFKRGRGVVSFVRLIME